MQYYDKFPPNFPGTYNNQYMVLDLKQIELNKEIRSNALWVVEQIPGYVGSADVTPILREGMKKSQIGRHPKWLPLSPLKLKQKGPFIEKSVQNIGMEWQKV